MAFGAALAAFSIEEFLVPCLILDGGVVGISIIISSLTPLSLSLVTIVLNIPFLLIGTKRMGKTFVIKSFFSMLVFSVCLSLFAKMDNATEDYLLAVCFGGTLLGLGVGIVIRFGGCLDGTEVVAIILNKRFQLPVGRTVLVFNVIIYSVAGVLFGLDRAMYSLLTYFITSKVIDMVETGVDRAKAATIITDDAEEIARLIYERLGRTVTKMNGVGLVSGEKEILYCVITSFEVWELKSIISSVDRSAFITITDVSEIIGKHIKTADMQKTE